jgi:aryl-alcohol dehydrogenase-like predicted oxidoreductase
LIGMEYRRLGRLGHQSSVLIYGAAAVAEQPQDVADASFEQALDAGINHFDVAASYGDAELRLGAAMHRMRDRIFLATKTGERAQDAAWRQINASLERLQTDHVDLIQLHSVGDLDELDRATGADGALHAAVRAQEEGLVGAVGITGHGHQAPATHLEALRRYPFATVLSPINPVLARDLEYLDAYEALVDEVLRQDAGLMIIKSVAQRNWPDGVEKAYTTWYEPLKEQRPITAAVAWVLSHDEVTGIATPSDVRLLPLMIRAEQERHALSRGDADAALLDEPDYSSPFITIPF